MKGMADCSDVQTGHVEVSGENYERIQAAVDRGQNLWRLSPVRTAQVVGSALFGFSPNDAYTFVEQYVEEGSGLTHAIVRVKHAGCVFLVDLYQPEKQGPKGIWVMESITRVT
jgi:hypothetical protein